MEEIMTARNAADLASSWMSDSRWAGIERTYSADDVLRLSGSIRIRHTLAERGAERLWRLLHEEDYVAALGALTGNQAIQRADQIHTAEGKNGIDWMAPIVADAEAGFGGPLNAFELMKGMIEAGAAAVHFEDQLSSEKKCGHLGGKVLVPTSHFVRTLVAARLAADVQDVPALVIARTDADSARLLTSDVDPRDRAFCTGERSSEGFFRIRGGLEMAIARALSYAPYADLLWCETSTPDLDEAKRFAEGIHRDFPGKMLAYNCSPSFNWRKHLDEVTIARFQRELGAMGYKFQFVTLAGFHALNHATFELE